MNHAITEGTLLLVFEYLILIVPLARFAGAAAARFGQPRAVGEIVGGIVAGAALSAAPIPTGSPDSLALASLVLSVIGQLGVVLMMVHIGMEFDFGSIRRDGNLTTVMLVTAMGIAAPFATGVGVGYLTSDYFSPKDATSYRLFIGLAFAITALPILGRILLERRMNMRRTGVITMSCAALNDLVGWVLLGVVALIAGSKARGLEEVARNAALLAGLACAVILIRPRLGRFLRRVASGPGEIGEDMLCGLLVVALGMASVTLSLGVFAVLGGAVAGMMLFDQREIAQAWKARVAPLVMMLLVPVFFTYTGMRLNIGSLNSGQDWAICLAFVAASCLSKFVGSYAGARLSGETTNDAATIGVLLNTRGLMELVVLNVGLDIGVIPSRVFTILVVMAIFSTVVTAPLLDFMRRRRALPNAQRDPLPLVR